MTTITCPKFTDLDRDIIDDFSECLQENIDAIEICVGQLDQAEHPSNELFHRLFRDVHSFKGNCRMVFLDPLVETIHALEEIISDMRQGTRAYHPVYGEFVLAIIVRMEVMISELISFGKASGIQEDELLKIIDNIRSAPADKEIWTVNQALKALSGEPEDEPEEIQEAPEVVETLAPVAVEVAAPVSAKKVETIDEDLVLFKKLALQLDALNVFHHNRTPTILALCLSTNEDMGALVCPKQLTAAVYMHDFGMALVPHGILGKKDKLTAEEIGHIQNHVSVGYQLLKKIPGWSEAAEMALQHHEKYNGRGYPNRLAGERIHPGAMIIALADTFYAVTNQRVDRSYKKSLFSAVTMINGESAEQFDPKFVEAFNNTIRSRYIARAPSDA